MVPMFMCGFSRRKASEYQQQGTVSAGRCAGWEVAFWSWEVVGEGEGG